MGSPTVFTIGHSTRPLAQFVDLLDAHGVRRVVDVRSVRGSRHNPQYGEAALREGLAASGIGYAVVPALGGLRYTRADADSPNGAWRNASFRAYADHMQTPEFAGGVADLLELARAEPVAIMCAEAVPWRCHRSLIGDALLVRGARVRDIMSATRATPHELTRFARVDGERVWYPPET